MVVMHIGWRNGLMPHFFNGHGLCFAVVLMLLLNVKHADNILLLLLTVDISSAFYQLELRFALFCCAQ